MCRCCSSAVVSADFTLFHSQFQALNFSVLLDDIVATRALNAKNMCEIYNYIRLNVHSECSQHELQAVVVLRHMMHGNSYTLTLDLLTD